MTTPTPELTAPAGIDPDAWRAEEVYEQAYARAAAFHDRPDSMPAQNARHLAAMAEVWRAAAASATPTAPATTPEDILRLYRTVEQTTFVETDGQFNVAIAAGLDAVHRAGQNTVRAAALPLVAEWRAWIAMNPGWEESSSDPDIIPLLDAIDGGRS